METLFCQHSSGGSGWAVCDWDSRPVFGLCVPELCIGRCSGKELGVAEIFQGHSLPVCFRAAGLLTLHVLPYLGQQVLQKITLRLCTGPVGFYIKASLSNLLFILTDVRKDLRCSRHEGFEEEAVVLTRKDCAIRNHRALDLKFFK